ncbi:MAG: branched-chain amino acid ABC transporter permease [Hyphomicrobiaceae bacterium]
MKISSANLLGLGALVLLVVMPVVVSSWVAADFGMYFVYAIFAVSLAFLWGHVGLLSLGHAVYFGIGAYAMSIVTLGMVPGLSWLVSAWVGLAAAVVLAGAFAWLVGSLFFAGRRPLRGAFLGIVTLALAVIIERLAINSTFLGGLNGLLGVPPMSLGLNGGGPEIVEPLAVFYAMLGLLAVVSALVLAIQKSRFGLALASVRENELRASTLGHDATRLKVRAMAVSGALAGLAGALFVVQFGFASPSLIGFTLSADVLIWVALGGRGHIVSAALGAIGVRYLESQLSDMIGATWPLALGAVFVLCVIVFPRGVFGEVIGWIDAVRALREKADVRQTAAM